MTDAERFQWLVKHPTPAAGIVSQFHDQCLMRHHWNDTPEQRYAHLCKLMDYTIRYTREEHRFGCPCRIEVARNCECGL